MNGLPRRAVAPRSAAAASRRARRRLAFAYCPWNRAYRCVRCSQLIYLNAANLRVACAVQFVSHRTLEGERDDFEVTDVLKHLVACGCVGLLLATPMKGNAGAQEAVINQVTLQGTVQSVDHVGRTVTIRGAQGNIVTLDVPMSVTRFDQVKVGDTISATYSDRVERAS